MAGALLENGRSRFGQPGSPVVSFQRLCVQRQTAAVRMFLRLFRFGILAFEVFERHVQRFMTEDNSGSIGGRFPSVYAIWECLKS